jgi:hypothetical protein
LLSFSPEYFVFPSHTKKELKIKIYKTLILQTVCYGCESWSLALREEHGLRVSENRALKMFGPKREGDGSWRKLHDDEIHGLFFLPNIVRVIKSRRVRWAGHVARMGRIKFLQGSGWEVRREETTSKTNV